MKLSFEHTFEILNNVTVFFMGENCDAYVFQFILDRCLRYLETRDPPEGVVERFLERVPRAVRPSFQMVSVALYPCLARVALSNPTGISNVHVGHHFILSEAHLKFVRDGAAIPARRAETGEFCRNALQSLVRVDDFGAARKLIETCRDVGIPPGELVGPLRTNTGRNAVASRSPPRRSTRWWCECQGGFAPLPRKGPEEFLQVVDFILQK
mmetsp:Transcript_29052/g.69420  ORF Transcript_29052/g.69420 Transcript_29052/m.69420 type:complete len:211 (+) Transcript_29052:1034-1666(+)